MKKLYFIGILATIISLSSCTTNNNSLHKEEKALLRTDNLFMVNEISDAYKNETRNRNGEPGKKYWQNRVDYSIKAKFNPKSRLLEGSEIIKYKNNSPDTLTEIVISLYQDIYRKGTKRDWDIGDKDITEGVKINELKIGNRSYEFPSDKVKRNGTVLTVILDNAIQPGSEADINIDWNFTMPEQTPIRMGRYNETSFHVAYWYPKIAVYDDLEGWDKNSYTGRTEFYSEYGNFDVEINLPSNYLAWSSGVLQNEAEIFLPKYLERIEKAKTSNDVIHILTKEDHVENKIVVSKTNHTFKFRAENFPDFAFSVSDNFLWDATSAKAGEKTVSVHAVYKENSKDFHEVAQISKDIIEYFSNEMPAIPYPYPQLVAFNGGGGMEFPGIINDGDTDTHNETLHLTSHEIGHTYFPFYVGINEARYAWMDEGLVSFFPRQFVMDFSKEEGHNPFEEIVERYNAHAKTFNDFPQMLSSNNSRDKAYRFHAYRRSSAGFQVLREMIGNEKVNKGLQLFAERWKSKHPTPFDFYYTFNEVCGEDLAWFWKPWFFDMAYADLAIGKIETQNGMKFIEIIKKGEIPVPIRLNINYKDGSERLIKHPASVWKTKSKFIIEIEDKEIISIKLDSKITPDADVSNNEINF